MKLTKGDEINAILTMLGSIEHPLDAVNQVDKAMQPLGWLC